MKKIKYLLLLLAAATQLTVYAMDPPQGSNSRSKEDIGRYGIFRLVAQVPEWFGERMQEIEDAVAPQHGKEEEEEQAPPEDAKDEAPHPAARLLLKRLATLHKLSTVFAQASEKDDPETFVALVEGLPHVQIEPTKETAKIITKRLGLLQQAKNGQIRKELEGHIAEAQKIHVLRKRFSQNGEAISSDEGYTDLGEFAKKLTEK